MVLPGILIRRARLERQWSQEGLCSGICAVSYLSKIEQGRVQPSPEISHLLLERLGIRWYDDEASIARVSELIERGYDAVLTMDERARNNAHKELDERWEVCANGPFMLDALLLQACFTDIPEPLADDYEHEMDLRQRTLWLLTKELYDEALRINPIALCYAGAGIVAYEQGRYAPAIGLLQRGYDFAARDGYVHIMLQCSILIGNCHSNMLAFPEMEAEYQTAKRLAVAVGDYENLRTIDYNIASTRLELGEFEEAYRYFSVCPEHTAATLHKLSICCEKLGKTEEAHAALDMAETAESTYPDSGYWSRCCALVRYRLEHPTYLQEDAYGEMLLSCFADMRKTLPSGYAGFHLPWVLEWYRANRQYKQAFELLLDFPGYCDLGDR